MPEADNPNLNYKWFLDNFNNLKSNYYGEWIAIHDQRLVAHNFDHKELIKEVKKQNIKRPFITRVLPEFWE